MLYTMKRDRVVAIVDRRNFIEYLQPVDGNFEDFEHKIILYLAVPVKTYEDFFTMPFVQSVIQRSSVNLLVFNP